MTTWDPRTISRFNLLCRVLTLVALVTVLPLSAILRRNFQDFGPFYMGGVMARHGAWSSLYPEPLPGSPTHAGEPDGSWMEPRFAQRARERGVPDTMRFIQLPPHAVIVLALAGARLGPSAEGVP